MKREKISECPEELQEIIYSVNLLPKDLERFERDLAELGKQYSPGKFRKLVSSKLEKRIKYTVERNGFLNVQFQLRRLVNEKIILVDIISAFREWDSSYNRQPYNIDSGLFNLSTEDSDYNKRLVLKPTFNLSKPLTAFSFNVDTSLELLSFQVLELLKRDNIPIERLGICPVCQDIFWAKRIKEIQERGLKRRIASPYCSDPCGNTYNARKTRIRKLETELTKESKKLEKLQMSLSSENSLIAQQKQKVFRLKEKIERRKRKYGTL